MRTEGLVGVQLSIKCWIWLLLSYNRVHFKGSPSINIFQKVWDKLLIWQLYKEWAERQECVYWGSVCQVLVLCRIPWSHTLAAQLRNCSSLFSRPPEPACKLPWHVAELAWQGGQGAFGSSLSIPSPSSLFPASKSILPPTGAKEPDVLEQILLSMLHFPSWSVISCPFLLPLGVNSSACGTEGCSLAS